ncbi:FtsW/RodA/SpoVE family cell cycle protein [Haliscomenobacter sp.]|jgi:cell division protein FtsW|uniref:FtsW/RodA/SpoVE family cell cycle protein n=1 Tax=Haliscomenobacter sp. TaxID=2717303 RepID=UPI003364EDF0
MSVFARISSELQGDRSIWAVLSILAVFSLLVVYSSTGTLAYQKSGGHTEIFLIRQTVFVFGGLLITYLCHTFNYMRFHRAAPYLFFLTLPLLIYTLFFGANINDARRWIQIPFTGLTFQTSDFAKLALVIYVARSISAKQDYIKDWKSAFIPIIVPVLIVCGLIAPADLSTAVLLFFTCLMMMFVGRVDVRFILALLILGLMVFAMLIFTADAFPGFIRVETWSERIRDFVTNPDGGYQVQQAKIAIANGEWFGVGPGNSIQRNYLPSPYSDFIYAILCEEYGIIGGTIVISMYIVLFFRITRLVTKSSKAFGAMVALGLGIMLITQAFVNISTALHLIPVAGVTLPMVSRGGTSTLFTCIAFGIILSVSRFVEINEAD